MYILRTILYFFLHFQSFFFNTKQIKYQNKTCEPTYTNVCASGRNGRVCIGKNCRLNKKFCPI